MIPNAGISPYFDHTETHKQSVKQVYPAEFTAANSPDTAQPSWYYICGLLVRTFVIELVRVEEFLGLGHVQARLGSGRQQRRAAGRTLTLAAFLKVTI